MNGHITLTLRLNDGTTRDIGLLPDATRKGARLAAHDILGDDPNVTAVHLTQTWMCTYEEDIT